MLHRLSTRVHSHRHRQPYKLKHHLVLREIMDIFDNENSMIDLL